MSDKMVVVTKFLTVNLGIELMYDVTLGTTKEMAKFLTTRIEA